MAAIIGYLRVSTKGQGESGLGLEAQQAAIEAHARQHGGKIAALYVEVESGKLAERPELAKALAHAKRSKGTLVVAKLDRLARNVEFLARVMNSGCEFAAADMPAANRFMLHVMAAVAEHEAKAISDRTKAALAAYKARGGKLGGHLPQCRNLTPEAIAKGRQRSAMVRAKAAAEAYDDLHPIMEELRSKGASLQAVADELNNQGHTTRRGRAWNPVQVLRVLERAKAARV
jgi:DNA invertase Pin-like site-specific DNA recombinase